MKRLVDVAVVGLGIMLSVTAASAADAPAAPAAADKAAPAAETAPAAAPAPDAAPAAGTAGSGQAGSNKQKEGGGPSTVDPKTQPGKSAKEGATWSESRWVLDSGEPTYRISEDGTVDWATYEGFKRYHSECHVCHGPNGLGSTFAPALADSLKTMTYDQFKETVSSGRQAAGGVMPAFAPNPNVMCYVDDLYTYLKARADGALKSGQAWVKKRVAKTKEAQEFEKSCME
ncbi:MAG: c-type cytochrome, methanol metabolism-related [Hyphomicrobiaceae bacterium]|nr:c-type cytochrome, methanol metabolism-related [Hyphomicrobiaceae bacterium]